MGKVKRAQKSRLRRDKANPMNGNRSKVEYKDEKTRQEKIIPLIAKLGSATAADRAMAISAVTAMVDEPKLRSLLLKEKLIQTVMTQSLSDSSEEIVAEAFGLLRNLVVEEGYDVAVFMYRQDILTAIEAALQKVTTALGSDAQALVSMTGEQKHLIYEYLENLLGLISALAYTNEELFEGINARMPDLGALASSLLTYLITASEQLASSRNQVPKSVTDSVLDLCYVLSEANETFLSKLSPQVLDTALNSSIFSPVAKAHANGVKYNLYIESKLKAKGKSNTEEDTATLLEILESLLSIAGSINIGEAQENIRPVVENAEPAVMNESSRKAIDARSSFNAIEVIVDLFAAVAETIEIDPSIIYGGEEAAMDEDNEDEDISDDAFFEQSIAMENETSAIIDSDIDFGSDEGESAEKSPVVVLKSKVLPLLVRLLSTSELQERSMASLNNVCWTLTANISAKDTEWLTACQGIFRDIIPFTTSDNVTVATSALGVLAAVVTSLKGLPDATAGDIEPVTTQLISRATSLSSSVAESAESVNYIVAASRVLAVLAQVQGRFAVTKQITDFFLSIINSPLETPSPILVEALNAIFDVFGDKAYDYDAPIFVADNWLAKLRQVLPVVRQAARRIDKKKQPEARLAAEQTALNLARFIDYKHKE